MDFTGGGRLRIGVDTGGTFTDVVALDEDTGTLLTTKTPSTPDDPARGFLTGVRKVLDLAGATPERVVGITHGTTVATNQLLEGRTGRLGLITTEGYEHLLEIARQSVPDGYGNSYFWVKPARIVPADLVRTIPGRLAHTGAQIRPFDPEAAVRVARWFAAMEVTAVGVCLLHAYAEPAHEQLMRDILRAECPQIAVSLSSDVLREYREYERAVTTLVDAAVKPTVSRYVAAIAQRLGELVGDRPFSIMKSNGGVLSAAEIVRQPITTALSGPAAGALGAAFVAARAGQNGFDRVLTLDGGGTSTDVCLVVDGRPGVTTEGSVGAHPTRIPMVDVVTVGAGGGSVAWLSPEGTLKVGPRSAGAVPGPLCYGAGGTEPTVTDAHLVLGRIPAHLLGGEIPLDVEAAVTGLTELGGKLGLDLPDVARGVLEISAWNQANALRQVSVQRGLDVRDFALVTFGGSGSLLACRLLEILGLSCVVVPRDPGNLSAFGLLTVDVKVDQVQTAVQAHENLDLERVAGIYATLEAATVRALAREGFTAGQGRLLRSADLRYAGQAYEVTVDAPSQPGDVVDRAFAEQVADRFHAAHQRLYGYSFAGRADQRIEWVNLRVTGIGPITRPDPAPLDPPAGPSPEPPPGSVPRPAGLTAQHPDAPAAPQPTGPAAQRPVAPVAQRLVTFEDGPVSTPIHDRTRLPPGSRLTGPAVIEEYGSTVPVHPGFGVDVDRMGNLVITREAAG